MATVAFGAGGRSLKREATTYGEFGVEQENGKTWFGANLEATDGHASSSLAVSAKVRHRTNTHRSFSDWFRPKPLRVANW